MTSGNSGISTTSFARRRHGLNIRRRNHRPAVSATFRAAVFLTSCRWDRHGIAGCVALITCGEKSFGISHFRSMRPCRRTRRCFVAVSRFALRSEFPSPRTWFDLGWRCRPLARRFVFAPRPILIFSSALPLRNLERGEKFFGSGKIKFYFGRVNLLYIS